MVERSRYEPEERLIKIMKCPARGNASHESRIHPTRQAYKAVKAAHERLPAVYREHSDSGDCRKRSGRQEPPTGSFDCASCA